MDKPIYPTFKINYFPNQIQILTYLRKKHDDGKWYLFPYSTRFSLANSIDVYYDISRILQRTHMDIHRYLLFTKIVPGSASPLYHELDADQREEKERFE